MHSARLCGFRRSCRPPLSGRVIAERGREDASLREFVIRGKAIKRNPYVSRPRMPARRLQNGEGRAGYKRHTSGAKLPGHVDRVKRRVNMLRRRPPFLAVAAPLQPGHRA